MEMFVDEKSTSGQNLPRMHLFPEYSCRRDKMINSIIVPNSLFSKRPEESSKKSKGLLTNIVTIHDI